MMLVFVILFFIIFVITVEIYVLLPKNVPENKNHNSLSNSNKINEKETFNVYHINNENDTNIEMDQGKIYIKDDISAFIKLNDKIIPIDKDVVYNITEKFYLEIINIIKGKTVSYYYLRV